MWAAIFFVVSMAFTPEQFNVIVEMMKQVTLAQHAVRTPADPPGLQLEQRGRIDAKCFRAIAFEGGAKEWRDWSFAFKRTVRSCSRDAHILLDFIEKQTMDIQMHLLGGDGDGSSSVEASKLSAELHDVLCRVVGKADAHGHRIRSNC